MTLLAQPMSELQRMHQFLQGSSRFPHTSFREAEVGLSVLFSLKGSLGLLVQLPHVTTARVTNPAWSPSRNFEIMAWMVPLMMSLRSNC